MAYCSKAFKACRKSRAKIIVKRFFDNNYITPQSIACCSLLQLCRILLLKFNSLGYIYTTVFFDSNMENTHLLLSFYLVSHFMVKTRYCIFKNLVQSNINFVNTTLTVIIIIFIISWCSQCMMKISFISITSTVFLKKSFLLAGNVDELPSCQVRLSEKKKGEVWSMFC